MTNKFKRIITSVLTSAMIMSMGITAPKADSGIPNDGLLVDITFDEAGTGSGSFNATKGGTVKENGKVSYVTSYDGENNKALSISTNAAGNYLELPKGILDGSEAATFTFWIKPESGWPFMTTTVEIQDFLNEKYLGMLAGTSAFTAERYNNSGSRLSSVSTKPIHSDWQYVTVIFESGRTRLYINGEFKNAHYAEVDIKSLMTADASTWIGHGNWGAGEGFSGKIDNFRIYGKALSDEEIAALSAEAVQREALKRDLEKSCVDVNTSFSAGGNKVFQIKSGEAVSINTSVTNYLQTDKTIQYTVAAFDDEDNQLAEIYTSDVKTLGFTESAEYSAQINSSDVNAAYYKVIIKDITDAEKPQMIDAGYLPVSETYFPPETPADSAATTEGAHDPTIFKDPVSGHYFAYSSHNLIFESEDLINWTKHDYTKTITVPESNKEYIANNFYGAVANGTYWAPDILYVEGDEYPYWFYVSTASNLDAQNSVIGLVKAKSPGIWDGEYKDCGVVVASTSQSGSPTNAIDANIFTDTDGKVYFIWGSFWKGTQIAELDMETGLVKGVDYTSDASILSSSNSAAVGIFSTPRGVVGPEAPFAVYNADTGYRYMFTSYGWLGSNYNIRVARTNKTFSEVISQDADKQLLDHKGRPVGATYSNQVNEGGTLDELWGYKISGSFRLGDGIEYVGSGHNSVFRDDDGSWYLVQHCRKIVDYVAYLQVKKILWTEDGWPVISPLVYAGENEQTIPEKMLYGTWDLSSVGHTIFDDGVTSVDSGNAYKGTDLPVRSSQIILQSDGSLGNNLGTWSFDGDHTVTINFTKDGDNENYEFYKAGDTMTLFALTGYDKDKRESAIVLTGTDQELTAQFAKKNNAMAQGTKVIPAVDTVAAVIEKSSGNNPVLGFDADGNIMYGGDPAAVVVGDTVYLYVGHDAAADESYVMPNWACYSSKDMIDWKYEGIVMEAKDISWASNETSAWASQAVPYNGKYYLYYCTWDKTSEGKQSIGVAVADSPTGPFKDKGEPLVKGTLTSPQANNHDDIDPTVWIETVDGVEHRYLAWGNTKYYVCELNEDMVTVKDMDGDGAVTMNNDIKEQKFTNLPAGLVFTEAPWLYRRKDADGNYTGKYYTFGAFGWREQMGYATADSPYGPWEFGGIIMQPTATSNTNHPSVIDFNGKTYFIYHNGALPHGSGFRRSVCIQELNFDSDGRVIPLEELSVGLAGTASTIQTSKGKYIGHDNFENPSADNSYPILKDLLLFDNEQKNDTAWEIVKGKYEPENDSYVSIQAVNKPGLYIKTDGKSVMLTQDADGNQAKAMTFKTVKAIDGSDGISFESVAKPGKFLAVSGGTVTLSYPFDLSACSFNVQEKGNVPAVIENQTLKDDKVSFVLKNGAEYKKADLYIAEYDGDTMVNVSVSTLEIQSDEQSVSVDYKPVSDNNKIAVMIWNSNMQPVAEKAVIE